MSFVPVNFCSVNRTIRQAHLRESFKFSPACLAIQFVQSLAVFYATANGDPFNTRDLIDDLEICRRHRGPIRQLSLLLNHNVFNGRGSDIAENPEITVAFIATSPDFCPDKLEFFGLLFSSCITR